MVKKEQNRLMVVMMDISMKMNGFFYRNTIFTMAFLCLNLVGFNLFCQEDNLVKEVQVVRPYEPSISDAFKINQMPKVEDTLFVAPQFSYNLALRPTTIDFPVKPIPSAKMVAEPLTKIYKGYVKAGFGNYSSPLAEVYFGSSRSKGYSYGAYLMHNSSFGKVRLDNNDKVEAPFSSTVLSVYGKKIFQQSSLAGSIGFKHNGYNFYGYDTTANLATANITHPDQMQRLITLSALFRSTHSDSLHLNYNTRAGFTNFADKFGMAQNSVNVKAHADKFFRVERVGGEMELIHHAHSPELDSVGNTLFNLSPWIGFFGKQWRVKAGVGFTLDANRHGNEAHFYPIGQLSYDIISHYVIPYVEFGGYLENNSYSKIIAENPWIEPGLRVWNTSHKYIMLGGVKGNLSAKMAYNLSASYSLVDSMFFFVNKFDTGEDYLQNAFGVVYDNVQHKQVMGELTFAPTARIKLFAQAEYHAYTLQDIEKPWHKPNFVGRISASYNMQDKLMFKASFFAEGKRFVQTAEGSPLEIDGLLDFNLSAEYRYNSRVSAFLDLNNISGNRYHVWYLYPVQQFNMRLGLTYSF